MEKELNTNTETTETMEQSTQPATYTQEQFEAALQAETDRRVTTALKKKEKEAAQRISQAEKLARMNEEEKREFELKQREEALAAKERELMVSANKVECLKILSDKKLPAELVDFVVSDDADTMQHNIKLFERLINKAVSEQVRERIGTGSPQIGTATGVGITKDSFKKMSIAEQSKLFQENPELYKELAR